MTMCIETSSRHTATVTSTLFRFLSILFVALFVTSAAQAGSEWTVSAIEGDAKIVKEGIQPVALSPGDELAEGDRVVTGETGRAVLTRGGSTIVVAPGTEMSIPLEKTNGLATRILQKVGTLFLNVEKKKTEHFEVVTPYLAAVVKGTSFTVNVDRSGAAVHVMEGLVQVADAVSGQAVFVRPGQTATRNAAAAGLDVKGQKASAPGQQKKAEAETDSAGLDNSQGDNNAGGNGKAQGAVNSASGQATAAEASDGKAGGNGKAIGRSFEIVSVETPVGTGPSPGSATGQINRSVTSNAGGNAKSNNAATNVSGQDTAVEARNGKAGGNGKAIGRTLGVVSLDVAVVTVSLPGSAAAQANRSATSGTGGNSNGNGGGVDSGSNAAGNGGAGSTNVASGNPSAGGSVGGGIGGGNPSAGGGNPNAGGGNPNAGGGNGNGNGNGNG